MRDNCTQPAFDKGNPTKFGLCLITSKDDAGDACNSAYKEKCSNGNLFAFAQPAKAGPKYLIPTLPMSSYCDGSAPIDGFNSDCYDDLRSIYGCNCTIMVCDTALSSSKWEQNSDATGTVRDSKTSVKDAFCNQLIYHEMVHCSGILGDAKIKHQRDSGDFVWSLGQCICEMTYFSWPINQTRCK
jgi:hypothetical protein